MIDMLHLLEKLNIIDNSEQWDMLREVRNIIAHEYTADLEERIDNIKLALSGFDRLKRIYASLQVYLTLKLFNRSSLMHLLSLCYPPPANNMLK